MELIVELNPNFAHKQHTPLRIKLQRDFFRITQEYNGTKILLFTKKEYRYLLEIWLCNVAKKPASYLWKKKEHASSFGRFEITPNSSGVQSCIAVPDGSSFFIFGLLESSVGAHSICNNKVSTQYTEKEI